MSIIIDSGLWMLLLMAAAVLMLIRGCFMAHKNIIKWETIEKAMSKLTQLLEKISEKMIRLSGLEQERKKETIVDKIRKWRDRK